MFKFKKKLKIYLFKNKKTVDFSIRVSHNCVNVYKLNQQNFEEILENWKTGIDKDIGNLYWCIEYKQTTSKPENAPTSYVRISVYTGNSPSFHYRVDYDDMLSVEKDYYYQKNNIMSWDNDR